jgi:hypothetical protein
MKGETFLLFVVLACVYGQQKYSSLNLSSGTEIALPSNKCSFAGNADAVAYVPSSSIN